MPQRVEAAEGSVTAKGHQQVTSLSTVKTLTVPDGVSFCMLQPITQGVWLTADGTTPSSTNGFPVAAGQTLKYTADPKLLKIIEQASSATVNVWYFSVWPIGAV